MKNYDNLPKLRTPGTAIGGGALSKKRLAYKLFAGLFCLGVIGVIGAISYAFFTVDPARKNQLATLKTARVSVTFADNDAGIHATLDFGESFTKKFTIENDGDVTAYVKMYWKDLINTYTEESLSYTLSASNEEGGTHTPIVGGENAHPLVPQAKKASTEILAESIEVPVGKTYYELTVTLNKLTTDQNSDIDAQFYSWFKIEDIHYTNIVDEIIASSQGPLNGGFDNSSPHILSYTESGFGEPSSRTQNSTYQARYYTYASSYTFDENTGKYTLTNPQVCKYSECYQNLRDKYISYNSGSTSSKVDTTKRSIIYKVTSDTTLNKMTYVTSVQIAQYKENNEGVFEMEDDFGTSYYFRGAVENNYVQFGKWSNTSENGDKAGKDMYWRIIRVNGDGSLRLIYAGTSAHANSDQGNDTFASSSKTFNALSDDAKYAGYMYSPQNEVEGTTTPSTEDSLANPNETSSDIKKILDEWYASNLEESYDKYISKESIFCNDRSTNKGASGWSEDTGLGYGNKYTAYGAFNRFVSGSNGDYASRYNIEPTLKCPRVIDQFTASNRVGNGDLTYPVGLITANEVVTAGSGTYKTASNYYLKREEWQWTLSPHDYISNVNVFVINSNGSLTANRSCALVGGGLCSFHIAPVINLTNEYAKTLIGTGTMDDVYRDPLAA